MRFWRKKSDGFDWHQYVRTTIKLRRDQRRARLENIGRIAAGNAKAAGEAAVNGVVGAAGSGWRVSVATWRNTVARPTIAFPIALCGGMALFSGLYRWSTIAHDGQAVLPLVIGVVLLALLAPLAMGRGMSFGVGRWPAVQMSAGAVAVALMAVVALALGWYAWGGALSNAPGFDTAAAPSASALEGRASVLSGEMIRLQGRLLHLSGIEAPDRQQTCIRTSKQPWRCGEVATAALEKLAKTKSFRCIAQGDPDAMGRTEAQCTVDGRDVGAELVKDGHVFSAATYFGGYAALEGEARRAGNGLWSGEPERPAAYRARVWAAAKAEAPTGCPIKARVVDGRKTYLMPWSSGYAQAAVRLNRGEQWFCDEADAQKAGYNPAGRTKSISTR